MKGIQAAFLHPQDISCENPQNFIFFLNQLHLHFTEPSEAFSLSERGLCRGCAGVHIWSWGAHLELSEGARTKPLEAQAQ